MIRKGDTIGIIALAGNCEKNAIDKAVRSIENLGFKVKLSDNIYNNNRYLAGSDSEKIEELHKFFLDPEIKLILNARGGYGSIRLINKIDYNIIKSNPKPFCGFSDITALLLMFYKKTGIITYHAPMACSDFLELNDFTISTFFKAINNESSEYSGNRIYSSGNAQGVLFGGNLATVASLSGMDFIPEEDFLFFAEDINEPVYKIDRMFTQLFNIEKFNKNCKGIILGEFSNVDNQNWLDELFSSFSVPTVGGFKITHGKEKITVPIGEKAYLINNILKW